MVIRVTAQGAEQAGLLVREFVHVFGGEHVSLDADGNVEVKPPGDVDRAIVDALDAVEHWLEAAELPSAQVWLDKHSYRVERERALAAVGSSR
jgi:hypothetical protein